MASKFILVRLNQQSLQALYGGNNQKYSNGGYQRQNSNGGLQLSIGGRQRSDSLGSHASNEGTPVEYSYLDTFTTLLEKCLIALNVKAHESSSTKTDDHASLNSRSSVTKQALVYDKEHMLITMLQEVKENETYFIEVIDSKLLALNHLASSPLLPPSLELQDSQGSDRGGSFNNFRQSSLAANSMVGRNSSFTSSQAVAMREGGRDQQLFSCDTDFVIANGHGGAGEPNDHLNALQFAHRQTRFKVGLVGTAKSGKTSLAYRFVDRTVFLDEYEPTIVDEYEQEMNMIDPSDGLNRVVNLTIVDIGHSHLKESLLQEVDAVLFCYDITNEESFFGLSQIFQFKMQMEYSTLAGNEDENEQNNEDDFGAMPAAMATLNQNASQQPQPVRSSISSVNTAMIASSQLPTTTATASTEPTQVRLRPVVLVGCKSDQAAERQVDYLDGERTAESFRAPYIECSAQSNHRVEDAFELVLIQLFK